MFNVFGYEHPQDRVFAFLKYIPSRYKRFFQIDFLERTWKHGRTRLFRAEKLYTAENYQVFLEAFRKGFRDYVYFCPYRGKEVISVPLGAVRKVYVPRERLRLLTCIKKKDSLQRITLDFVDLLSNESNIDVGDFGVHGSIALNMQTPKSDIDIVVYGAQNFRKLEKTVGKLVEARTLSYVANNRLDGARHFKGRYKKKIFMYNAIRKPEEIRSKYGELKYTPLTPVQFYCRVKEDGEAMFRPAFYEVKDYEAITPGSVLSKDRVPELVVSMIGCYRNIAKQGDRIKVSGTLESVENLDTGKVFHQVVVGTGAGEEEYIWPL